MENLKQASGKNLSTDTYPKFCSKILCFVALVYILYFFRKAVMRKLFDIRFSYKHCNFSRLLSRQDGVENRDKVYCTYSEHCTFAKNNIEIC